jgi:hypothetical protein
MKNPLLTHLFSLISDRSMKSLAKTIFMMVMFVNVSLAQAPFIEKSECFCLNNATTNTNGQYRDAIKITTGISGQTWRLINPISGFYNPASLPPPAAPILYLNNTLIPETAPGSGIYRLEGIRVSGTNWTVQVYNAATNFVQTVFSIQPCTYPVNVPITGDINVCQGSVEAYSLPPALYPSLSWTLTGGYTSTSPALPATGNTSINVTWGPTPGRYSLGVSGIADSYAAQPRGCNFSTSKNIDVVDPIPFTTIRGDFGNCIGARETYTIAAAPVQLTGVTWGVFTDAAGLIPAPGITTTGTVNSRTVVWPNTPGVFYLRLSGSFRVDAASDYCSFSNIQRVDIVNEPTTSLACNNLTQFSMNPSCELFFSADHFLEDQKYPNSSYDIRIRDIEKDTIIPNGTIGLKYINKIVEIKITHECSGNSCWGYAKIEDKSIADLICPKDTIITCTQLGDLNVTGYPAVPLGTIRTPVAGKQNTWILYGYDKCSDVVLSFTDKANTDLCTGIYSSIIERTWNVVDNSGNSSSCIQVISVLRANINTLVFPGNWDDITGPNPTLEACGDWPKILTGDFAGNPSPDYTGYPSGILCLKASVTFSDVKLPICTNNPNTYKLIRKWTVVDHCTGTIRTQNQFITVMDTQPPVITCPADLTTQPNNGPITPAAVISTNQHSCYADWSVLPPIVINDCSSTTWKVEFLLADSDGKPPVNGVYVTKSGLTEVTGSYPNFRIRNLPAGRTWVRYTVTDVCGNFTYCFTEIDVVDNQTPTPVCSKNSIIAIGAESTAYAGVATFNDGSHDNCEIACLKIRRMDNLVSWESLPCNNLLKFTCDDIGPNKTVMVELGVWDKGGLFNSCMVEAKVQDNLFPILTIPANATANCYEDLTSLTRFGTATATDNCSVIITETRKDNLNECRLGTIVRTFIATDPFGNVTKKDQIITVDNNRKFNGNNDIVWPRTITLTAACIQDVTPDKLPSGSQKPQYVRNTECASLAQNYEDIVFNFADNVCVKILRKWTVIDWCQKNPFIPGSGEWSYTQLIMLNNTTPPVISKGCQPADLEIVQVGECRANVKVTAAATDDCTPADKLEWTYTIDEFNDNTLEVTNGLGKTINRDFPYGTHKITWTVKDGCKNPRSCSNVFTIRDDKKPTPYCISEIVTVIMPSSKEITIWASDFDLGATDNCSTKSQLTASFSGTNKNDISRTIKCADLGGANSKQFTYNVYVYDAAGNNDFCTVSLIVQDNGNSCRTNVGDDEDDPQSITIKGNIYNESDDIVQNVSVELKSDQSEFPKSITTGSDGKFSFADLPMYKDYSVSADKNDDALNGVTTLDLVLIQRHILGLSVLDSPYKLIAADINNSQSVSAADLVELRKLILGIQNSFANNRSWRFIDVAYRFSDPKNPFPFNDYMEMTKLDHNKAGLDFMAVKVGDVNGSAKPNLRSTGEVSGRSFMPLITESVTGKAGDLVTIHLTTEEINALVGLQMTLAWDINAAELIEIKSDVIQLKDYNLGFGQLNKGFVHISWNTQDVVSVNNQLVTLKMRLLHDVSERQLIFNDKTLMNPEIYTKEGSNVVVNNIKLESGLRDKKEFEKFELYQNVPNPFNAATIIGFYLPKADAVNLKIYDLTGKMIYQTKAHFSKGYNTFNVDAGTLNLNGVMYYQIDTETDSATRKMIVIK